MEFINKVGGTLAQIGDEVEICTKGEDMQCFRAKIVNIGGEVTLEVSSRLIHVPIESFRIGVDENYRYRIRPYHPEHDPDPLIQTALKILKEES